MKKILVIEDNDEVRENIAEILELSNYRVITAPNGKVGVATALHENPDLIICDIMMPELDGYGVLHLLNQHTETYGIPFIFLTAKTEKADMRKGMELGADDYITKPFDGIELLKAVETRLKKADAVKQHASAAQSPAHNLNSFIDNAKKAAGLSLISDERELYDYKKKQMLYKDGQRPKAVYYIKSGKVKIYKTNDDGKELITGILSAGEFAGYVYAMENINYRESAQILEDAEIITIPKEDFLTLLWADAQVSKQFIKLVTQNVIEREQALLNIAYNSLRKKVAFLIISLLDKFRKEETGKKEIRLSRENLAQAAGIATESLIRTLSEFKSERLVDIQGGSVIILNEEKLRNLPY